MAKVLVGVVVILLAIVSVVAVDASHQTVVREMKLLAVSESASTLHGSTADLRVELVPGSGRVFIETSPLTKIDTQISARLAKQIACHFLDVDCSGYDFIYTIRSGSPTIGGPSAGAAITVLTIAALDDLPVRSSVSLTGTISSGGLIGSVGGIYQKVQAAQRQGLTTVLIPVGEREVPIGRGENASIVDVVEFGNDIGVTVREVATLYQAIEFITGTVYQQYDSVVIPPDFYWTIMGELASDLCERADRLSRGVVLTQDHQWFSLMNRSLHRAEELRNASIQSINENHPYAAASFCFGSALQYRMIESLQWDDEQLEREMVSLFDSIDQFTVAPIATTTDLQISMLVSERSQQATQHLLDAQEHLANNATLDARIATAYGIERLHSAVSWSRFFDAPGDSIELDDVALRSACALRVQEAQEREQYATIYMLDVSSSDDLSLALQKQSAGNYAPCIFHASKAKARYDVLIGAIGSSESSIMAQLEYRIKIGRQQINRQIAQGVFPIAAYSYVEYADSLRETDLFSALLYAQYAIELADIQIYLEGYSPSGRRRIIERQQRVWSHTDVFIMGVALGMLLVVVAYRVERVLRRPPRRRHTYK